MKKHIDFKKEWEKTKKELTRFSKEAVKLAKMGEDEIIKFSHKGKLHLDSTAIGLKMERLYYFVGKEYTKLKSPTRPSAKLRKLIEQIKNLEKEQRSLKGKIKKTGKTRTTKRK